MRPDPSSLREALARTLTNQRREPDELVDEVMFVLRQYGKQGYLVTTTSSASGGLPGMNWRVQPMQHHDGTGRTPQRVLVIPLPETS